MPAVGAADPIPPSRGVAWSSLDGVEPPGLTPAIGEVLQYSAPTVRHTPSAAIRPVASLLEVLIQELVAHPSWETAHRFFCFPKRVLWAGRGRKGKGPRRQQISSGVCACMREGMWPCWGQNSKLHPQLEEKSVKASNKVNHSRQSSGCVRTAAEFHGGHDQGPSPGGGAEQGGQASSFGRLGRQHRPSYC